MMLLVSYASAFQDTTDNTKNTAEERMTSMSGYIDITPNEAWEMMSAVGDGKQIVIDVRRLDEYLNERIILPNDDDWIRWFPYELQSDGPGPIVNEGILLKLFIDHYADQEIIIYCRTGRRTAISAQILVDNGFTGTVYNVLGGITEWKAKGLPTTLNPEI